jgi:arsenate reductase
MRIYGIKTCDSCRKARRFLSENGIDHHWHDLRDDGLDVATVQAWLSAVGAETLVNRRSTTWRELDELQRVEAMSAIGSAAVLARHPTLIKRPVIDLDGDILVGFGAPVQERVLGARS